MMIAYFVIGLLLSFSATVWYKYRKPYGDFDHPDCMIPAIFCFFLWPLVFPVVLIWQFIQGFGVLAEVTAARIRKVRAT